ncbi:MAG: saccharopine dehydrogenase NADP-binding domain-containing protein [Bacteroidales bacterium]|nr:saccharopine dehydrogenase NADP-binding domain-containing protein [Bacteroidales bacterium]
MDKKKILVLGAGMVVKPAVDYFWDKCNYHVTIATRTVSKAEAIIAGRENASAVQWDATDFVKLDKLVPRADLIVNFIPPAFQAESTVICIKHKKHMIHTDFTIPEVAAMDKDARKAGVIILNEIGEDPGIDHMGIKKSLDEIKRNGGKVISLDSYGAGLPSFEDNRNPFGYKFSWNPKGLMKSALASGEYIKEGKVIEAKNLFDHFRLVDLEGLGTFETYPNRKCAIYKEPYELDDDVSFFRGLLRFTGWCNTMRKFIKLNLLDYLTVNNFENLTYNEFMRRLVNSFKDGETAIANYFNLETKDDFINRLRWLGFFEDKKIPTDKGSNVDVLVDLMLKKMSYQPHEKDMAIIHDDIVVDFNGIMEKWSSTMVVKGISGGDSAMARAVSLPVAIATRLILEGKITIRGSVLPVHPEIYNPVLAELEEFGIKFNHQKRTL